MVEKEPLKCKAEEFVGKKGTLSFEQGTFTFLMYSSLRMIWQ